MYQPSLESKLPTKSNASLKEYLFHSKFFEYEQFVNRSLGQPAYQSMRWETANKRLFRVDIILNHLVWKAGNFLKCPNNGNREHFSMKILYFYFLLWAFISNFYLELYILKKVATSGILASFPTSVSCCGYYGSDSILHNKRQRIDRTELNVASHKKVIPNYRCVWMYPKSHGPRRMVIHLA